MQSNHKTLSFFALITTLAIMSACTNPDSPSDSTNNAAVTMDSLVTTQWLSEHLDEPDLVILDTTVLVEMDDEGGFNLVSGRANYDAGHIPSAGFADLLGDLSGLENPAEFKLPPPEQFSAAMGALGIGSDSRVVLYTTDEPDFAARVWWMLRWAGFDEVALLDGGLQAWKAEGRALSSEPADRPAKQFTGTFRPEVIADRDQVFAATENGNVNIVDALPDAHYRGDFSMYGQPGHIPGATNMPSSDLLDEEGYYRSFDELDMMHDGDRNTPVITYCGGGVAASSVAFTMHRLGFTDVAVYIGSLQEWAADPANPMTLDTQ